LELVYSQFLLHRAVEASCTFSNGAGSWIFAFGCVPAKRVRITQCLDVCPWLDSPLQSLWSMLGMVASAFATCVAVMNVPAIACAPIFWILLVVAAGLYPSTFRRSMPIWRNEIIGARHMSSNNLRMGSTIPTAGLLGVSQNPQVLPNASISVTTQPRMATMARPARFLMCSSLG